MQTSVDNTFYASGIAGEFSRSENAETFGKVLASGTESNNVVGRAVNYVNGNDNNVGVAANGQLAGILCNPKVSVRPSLEAQAYLPNATQCDVAVRGYLWVTLPAVAAQGDFVYYSTTTGELQTQDQSTAPDAGYVRLPGGQVVGQNVTEDGLAEIYFDIFAGSTETPSA